MSTQRARWIDFDEYVRIEARSERKHEYDDGELTAMAGATARHVTIVQNIVAARRGHLRGSSCRVYSMDIRAAEREADGKDGPARDLWGWRFEWRSGVVGGNGVDRYRVLSP